MNAPKQRLIRSLRKHSDHWIFDTSDGIEFMAWGDETRLTMAQALSNETGVVWSKAERFIRELFKPVGAFEVEALHVCAERVPGGEDFTLHCHFHPEDRGTEMDYFYLNFEFGFQVLEDERKPLADRLRCLRFTVKV